MLCIGDSGRIYIRCSSEFRTNPKHRGQQWRVPHDCHADSVKTDQKCQRCAFATRKSRNTWIRATALSSSG
jgi:hypothetical protein